MVVDSKCCPGLLLCSRLLIHASPFLLILLPTLLLWTHPCLLQKLSFIFPKDRAALLP